MIELTALEVALAIILTFAGGVGIGALVVVSNVSK